MATNAPYYQMRGQFTGTTNSQFVPEDIADYDLSASAIPHDAGSYTDRQPSEAALNTVEETHNFVELLEAATTAATRHAGAAMHSESADSSAVIPGKGKRKRTSSAVSVETNNPAAGHGQEAPSSKRARMDVPTDPQLNGTGHRTRSRRDSSSIPPSSEALLNDARTAGVHSAAALFRRSTEKSSRKYTRPPMSKLFMSLQITPENFCHLQAQAKAYMLDPAHPERQSCVGNRGKGDTDMVKLRLFNCVRDFLTEGFGEQFFGEHVEKPGEEDAMEAARALGEQEAHTEGRLVWPRDGNKIISLVTPLLRRMVTNERQRMYAIESRKGGTKKKEVGATAPEGHEEATAASDPEHVKQARAAIDLTNSHPIAPIQNQHQHSYPDSPAPSLSVQPSSSGPAPVQEDAMSTPKFSLSYKPTEMTTPTKLQLPTEGPAEPMIRKVNIFITKNNIKLACASHFRDNEINGARLYFMIWDELQGHIRDLIKTTVTRYPQLEEMTDRIRGMEPEALRGLAVAATEIHIDATPEQANNIPPDTFDPQLSPNSVTGTFMRNAIKSPSAILPPDRVLPWKAWTIWTPGRKELNNEEDWENVKLDIAFAVWADRVMNIVVDLLDAP